MNKDNITNNEQLEKGMTEKEAVKKGLIRRDTVWVTAVDTLFGKGYNRSFPASTLTDTLA